MRFTHGIVSTLISISYFCAAAKFISSTDVNLVYIGRWSHVSAGMQSGWENDHVKTDVTTTTIGLQLARPACVAYRFDQEALQTTMAPDRGLRPILVDLEPLGAFNGTRRLILFGCNGSTLTVQGFSLSENGFFTVPNDASLPWIEFVGHGLLLGDGSSQSPLTGFPWLAATQMGADLALVAKERSTLITRRGISIGMESCYFSSTSNCDDKQPWSFSTQPSVVVVMLGHYDNPNNQDAYGYHLTNFLASIRKVVPHAPLVVLSEPLGEMIQPAQMAVGRRNKAGDQEVHYVDTTGWVNFGNLMFTDNEHLSDAGHQAFACRLAPLLQALLEHTPFPLPTPNPNLPNDWQTMDIGDQLSIGLPGSVSFDTHSTFTLWGSGTDIGGSKDAFRFVYQPLSNQGSIEASLQSHSAFSANAKAGIMLREHFAPGSPHVMLGISPADGVFVRLRHSNFNSTVLATKARASLPIRLRLTRTSNAIIAEIKQIHLEDTNWVTVATLPRDLMAPSIYAGLVVTSCNTSVVSVAKFVNAKVEERVGSSDLHHSHLIYQGASEAQDIL